MRSPAPASVPGGRGASAPRARSLLWGCSPCFRSSASSVSRLPVASSPLPSFCSSRPLRPLRRLCPSGFASRSPRGLARFCASRGCFSRCSAPSGCPRSSGGGGGASGAAARRVCRSSRGRCSGCSRAGCALPLSVGLWVASAPRSASRPAGAWPWLFPVGLPRRAACRRSRGGLCAGLPPRGSAPMRLFERR